MQRGIVSVGADKAAAASAENGGAEADNPQPRGSEMTLRESTRAAVRGYLEKLDGQLGNGVYQMVLAEVETPLLEEVLAYTNNNQSRASKMLGLSRSTLRKKLKQRGLQYKSRG